MLAGATLLVLAGCDRPAAPPELWFYYATNLADSTAWTTLEPVWRRAAAAGYRRVVLADPKFSRLAEMDSSYFATARRVRSLAEEVGLEIVPGLFPIGRSSTMLARDPHLVEGLPVERALFEARAGRAVLVPEPEVGLSPRPDGRDAAASFEPGRVRMRDHPRPTRFWFDVDVSPRRCYHASVDRKSVV